MRVSEGLSNPTCISLGVLFYFCFVIKYLGFCCGKSPSGGRGLQAAAGELE
jgi:hypothetical protein